MKTIQELYSEIMGSQELKAQFIEAAKAGKQEEFLKAHGCDATLEEVKAFLEAKQSEDAPLSFDELENAAGGDPCQDPNKLFQSVGPLYACQEPLNRPDLLDPSELAVEVKE